MSQSSFLEDVGRWSASECRDQLDHALPKLIQHLNKSQELTAQIGILRIIWTSFLPVVRHEDAEKLVFSKVSHKMRECFDGNLSALRQVATEAHSQLEQVQQQLTPLLQAGLSLIGCLESCVRYMSQSESLLMSHVHSLPSAILHIIHSSYSHCKESSAIYGELLSAISDQLSALFKRALSLQMAFLGLVDRLELPDDATEDDVNDMTAIVYGFYEISQVALSLDIKIMITLWKSISRLACQHKSSLCNRLDVGAMLSWLSTEMITSYDYLFTLIPSEGGGGGDEKGFAKNVKILSFQMKVLVTLVREYDGYLGDCISSLYKLTLHLQRNMPPVTVNKYPTVYTDEVHKQVTMAIEPLVSHLVPDVKFMQCATSGDQADNNELHLPHCLLIISILDVLPNYSDEIQSAWISPKQNPEDVPRDGILTTLFSSTAKCQLYLCDGTQLLGVMCGGRPQRNVSLYEHICTSLSAFTASLPAQHFPVLEECLLSQVLSSNLHCALLAIDVWCFIARYGSADLCRDHCLILLEIFVKIGLSGTPECCHLVLLLRRMLRFLAPEHQDEFIKLYPVADQLSLWSVIPLNVFAPSKCQSLMEQLIPVCTKRLHNWNHASKKTPLLTKQSIQSLQCLHSAYQCANVMPHITDSQRDLIREKCLAMWSVLSDATKSICDFCILQILTSSLLQLTSDFIQELDNSSIWKVVSTVSGLLSTCNCDAIRMSTLEFLRVLGKKTLQPSFEQTKILNELPRIFRSLLGDANMVVRQHTLETFAQFAEETAHESVVSDSLQASAKLQETVVTYLNQLSNHEIPSESRDLVITQCKCVNDYYKLSLEQRYQPSTWPEPDPQHTSHTTQDGLWWAPVNNLKRGVQDLQQLRDRHPAIPAAVIEELHSVYAQLGSLI